MSCFTLINAFLLILVAGNRFNRWGYMLPRPPVIPEPEKIHWYYGNSLKYFFLKHIFLLLGEHLHPSLEQSPWSGLETASFLPFSGQCKKHPKRLKETTQRWCANYIIRGMLQKWPRNCFSFEHWTIPIFFLQNDFTALLYPKLLGRQQAHGYAP